MLRFKIIILTTNFPLILFALIFHTWNSNAQINPHITSVLINSCNGTCSEGDNEIVFGNTGSHSVLATPANIELTYGSASNPTTTYSDSYVNNAATTSALNTAAGCGTALLVDAANTVIPPNSSFIITRSTICSSALNWSGICGMGPIYIIYSTDPTWVSAGNFANATLVTRYFRTRITNTLSVQNTIQYNYNLPALFNNDGAYVMYNPTGGAASSYGDNNCAIQPIMLPSELIKFEVKQENQRKAQLNWSTATEHNTERFEVHHSTDGVIFTNLMTIQAAGNSVSILDYSIVHDTPSAGLNYYQLQVIDNDGSINLLGVKSLFFEQNTTFFNSLTSELLFVEIGDYLVYSSEGKIIANVQDSNSTYFEGKGVFLVRNLTSGKTERIMIF